MWCSVFFCLIFTFLGISKNERILSIFSSRPSIFLEVMSSDKCVGVVSVQSCGTWSSLVFVVVQPVCVTVCCGKWFEVCRKFGSVAASSCIVCSVMLQGPKLTFFGRRQLATKFFFSCQMVQCCCQKVPVKLFLCSETQANIIGRHGLGGKIFAIDVIRNQTSAEIIFWPLWQIYTATFWHQRISKSSSYFFADVPSPPCNKLQKDFRTALDTTSSEYSWRKNARGLLCPQYVCYWKPLKKHVRCTVCSSKTFW